MDNICTNTALPHQVELKWANEAPGPGLPPTTQNLSWGRAPRPEPQPRVPRGETWARPRGLQHTRGLDGRQPDSARAWRRKNKGKLASSTLTRSLNVFVSSSSTAVWGASTLSGESCSTDAAMSSANSGSGSADRRILGNVVLALSGGGCGVLWAPRCGFARDLHQPARQAGLRCQVHVFFLFL